jgi:Protein of unknown function (DUF732)
MTDNDDQPATAAAGNDETTVVPPPTETAPPLAYSDELEDEEAGSWREAVGSAALPLFIASAVLLVSLVGFGVWLNSPRQEKVIVENTMTTVTTAPPAWTPPVVVTSTVPVTSTVKVPVTSTVTVQAAPPAWTPPTSEPDGVTRADDELFLQRLRADGFTISDPEVAVSSGRAMCAALNHGETYSQMFAEVRRDNASLPPREIPIYIDAVTRSYCPRLVNMLRD